MNARRRSLEDLRTRAGQPTAPYAGVSTTPTYPSAAPEEPAAPAGMQRPLGMVDKVLLSGPVSALFGKFGVNMTDVVARGGALP